MDMDTALFILFNPRTGQRNIQQSKPEPRPKNGEDTYKETFYNLLGDEAPELYFRFCKYFEDKVIAGKEWDKICDYIL